MDLRVVILRKLFRRRAIGGKHTAFEHITAGIPRHLHGAAKKTATELIKEGLVLEKPASYGSQISLNPARLGDVARIIEEGIAKEPDST